LKEFIELLISSGVDFIIIGGHAVAFHGHPRFTGDIDFLVRSTPENAERIIATLKVFGFGEVGLSIQDFTRPGSVVQLGRHGLLLYEKGARIAPSDGVYAGGIPARSGEGSPRNRACAGMALYLL
jgi:hypothetical protein